MILSAETGYIQSIDVDRVMRAALKYGTVVWLEHPVGGFAIAGTALARSAKGVTPDLVERVNGGVVTNHYRTLEQDPMYGIRQIVDIAIKSLSPGINDATTAATCIHYLTSILVYMAGRASQSCRHYHGSVLCAITRGVSFEAAVDETFHEIRQHSRGNVEVALRQLGGLERLAAKVTAPEQRQLVLRHARLVEQAAEKTAVVEHDREVVRERSARVAAAVEEQAQ